jgi:serine/threonine protein phosphatase PrpC
MGSQQSLKEHNNTTNKAESHLNYLDGDSIQEEEHIQQLKQTKKCKQQSHDKSSNSSQIPALLTQPKQVEEIQRVSLSVKELSEPEESCFTFTGARGNEGSQPTAGHQCKSLPYSFGTYSRPGSGPEKKRKQNQDCFVVIDQWGGQCNQFLACVLDGHGPNGRLVSNFCRDVWQKVLLSELASFQCTNLEDAAQVGADISYLQRLISNASEKTDNYLQNSSIDTYVSGTTLTGIICCGQKCWSVNIGDSRVVGCNKSGAIYKAIDLTVDQTPNRADELQRITRSGGRVFEWGGVPRVWLPDVDMPGLAISRTLGDCAVKCVGVNSIPEIRSFEMNQQTPFVVVASSGVWEFISSQVAVDLVAVFHANGQSAQEACRALINECVRLWREEEDIVDDITAVVIFNLDYGDELPALDMKTNRDTASSVVNASINEQAVGLKKNNEDGLKLVPPQSGDNNIDNIDIVVSPEASKQTEDPEDNGCVDKVVSNIDGKDNAQISDGDEISSVKSDISGFSGFSQ